MDKPTTNYSAYNQTGREGVGWREREAAKASEQFARTPEGQRAEAQEAKIAALEARLAAVEAGNKLTPGTGISINGNVIALSSSGQQGVNGETSSINDVIVVLNGTAYYTNILTDGTLTPVA